MRPNTYDLFGEIPVTTNDIRAWLLAVPRLDPDNPRTAHYVRWFNVADKIRQAKACGTFEAITATAQPRHHRLSHHTHQ